MDVLGSDRMAFSDVIAADITVLKRLGYQKEKACDGYVSIGIHVGCIVLRGSSKSSHNTLSSILRAQRQNVDSRVFAMGHDLSYGIWGGSTPEDRQRQRRRTRRAASAAAKRVIAV